MKTPHPPVEQQVVVITGASSGIGRVTARAFAQRGASVVLAARGGNALVALAYEIGLDGGRALPVVCDVSNWEDVRALARRALDEFGRIDTWVNGAAVAEWAEVDETEPDEMTRIVRTNLLGTMFGTRAALDAMRQRGTGVIINIASVEARRALPFQSAYAASKHGVKGFTEALRMELARDEGGIEVALILPSSIDTPIYEHARSKIGAEPKPVPPVYDPATVADAILFASEKPRAEIVVGGAGKLLTLLERISPFAADRMMAAGGAIFRLQKSDRPDSGRDNLDQPSESVAERGGFAPTLRRSWYTRAFEQHPNVKRAAIGAAIAGAVFVVVRKRT